VRVELAPAAPAFVLAAASAEITTLVVFGYPMFTPFVVAPAATINVARSRHYI
jgi:predicted alpha/beta-hydrolase family hydrolase